MCKLRIVIVLLVSVFLLQGCSGFQLSQDADDLSHLLDDYLKAIENGVPSDMSLMIYNATYRMSTDIPLDEAGLILMCSNSKDPSIADKVVIDSTQLSSKIDQLKNINSLSLQKPLISLGKNLRIYYFIETETDGKVLEVGMYGKDSNMFVNGVEVEYDPAFFDLVEPYLHAAG